MRSFFVKFYKYTWYDVAFLQNQGQQQMNWQEVSVEELVKYKG